MIAFIFRKKKRSLNRIYFLVIFLIIIISSTLYPLDPGKKIHTFPISTWDIEDGLPQNSVMSILQTRDKYLWIGTERGLVRFDGVNFETYNSTKYKNIKNNRVTTMLVDSKGNLYSGSRGGGLVRIRDSSIDCFLKKDGLYDDFVLSLFEDSKGTIWIGTFKGLSKMDKKGNLSKFNPEEKFENKIITSLNETRDGRIWVGTYKSGLFSISGKRVNEYSIQNVANDTPIRVLMVEHDGKLWAGTNGNGLAYYKDDKFIQYENNSLLSGLTVFSLYEDKDHNIWIGTANGLNRLTGGKISKWSEENLMSKIIVRSLYEDHEGSLWVGTNTRGLFSLRDSKFNSLSSMDGLSADNVTCIFEDSTGGIWIGTDGNGLNYLRQENGGIIKIFTQKQGLSSNFIYSVAEKDGDEIWVGTGSGITILNRSDQSVKFRIKGKKIIPNDIINVLFTASDGSVWAGTSGGGIARFSEGRSIVYSTENGLSNNFVHAIYEEKDNTFWIGTYGGGASRFKDGKFTNFNSNSGLSNNFVFSINGDNKGNIWLGTGGGLNMIRGEKVIPIISNAPVFSDTIYNVLISDNNDIWLTSNMGLFKIRSEDIDENIIGNTGELQYKLFNSSDGLRSDECRGGMQPAGCLSISGKLFIPTTKGVSIFNPKKKYSSSIPPPVYINKIEGDHPFIIEKGKTVFHGKTKKIDFSFTALSFLVPEKIRFKVKLEGFDKNWSEIKNSRNRTISYTNLSSGKYNFKVIASNSEGVWNTTEANYNFEIRSLFYNSPLFLILITLFLLTIFIYLYIQRVRNIRRRESELKLIVDEQTKELRSSNIRLTEANEQKSELLSMAAHDLKNPLQAIIGFSELISLRDDCPENIKKNSHLILEASKGMLETINNTLNTTVIREGKVTISNEEVIDLTELSRLVVEIYSEFAKKKNQIVITRFWSDCFIKGEKERIKIIIENLLSNAIKYSPLNRNIILSVEKIGKNVVLSVKDEGSGFSEEDKKKMFEKFRRLSSKPTAGESSTGIGLSIVKRIVEMHGGKIWLESKEEEGSIFFVSFPGVDPVDTWKMK